MYNNCSQLVRWNDWFRCFYFSKFSPFIISIFIYHFNFHFYGCALENNKQAILDVRNIVGGQNKGYGWSCFNILIIQFVFDLRVKTFLLFRTILKIY